MLSSSALAWAALASCLLLVLACWKTSRTPLGRLLVVLRVVALVALAVLVWRVVWGTRSYAMVPIDPGEGQRRVVVLQDGSRSMDLLADSGRSRAELADDVWGELQASAAARGAEAPRTTRLFFGRNVVAEGRRGRLDPGATQMTRALGSALSLEDVDALLVVSDGAFTDGPVPAFFADWGANRGVSVTTLCAGASGARGFDRSVIRVSCGRVNPRRVKARVACVGRGGDSARVSLAVDGDVVQERVVSLGEGREVAFDIPELDLGWHEYAVRVEVDAGEATPDNNMRLGVFRVVSTRLLFLTDRPRIGNVHLGRFLRQTRGAQQVEVKSVSDLERAPLDAEGVSVVVVGDVDPRRVPARLMRSIERGETLCLLLPGEHLARWSRWVGSPLTSVTGRVNLRKELQRRGRVHVEPPRGGPAFAREQVERLPLNLVYSVELAPRSETLLSVVAGERSFPLLVVDDVERPRCLALLSSVAWKWSLSLDPATRGELASLLEALFEWLLPEDGRAAAGADLRLLLSADGDGVDATVRPRDEEWLPQLKDVVLRVTGGERGEEVVTMQRKGVSFVRRHSGGRPPRVLWFQAFGAVDGARLRSAKLPVVVQPESAELFDTALHPERLQALVGGQPGRFGFYADRERLVAQLLDGFEPAQFETRRRSRSPYVELALASLFLLLTSTGWFLERTLRSKGSAS